MCLKARRAKAGGKALARQRLIYRDLRFSFAVRGRVGLTAALAVERLSFIVVDDAGAVALPALGAPGAGTLLWASAGDAVSVTAASIAARCFMFSVLLDRIFADPLGHGCQID